VRSYRAKPIADRGLALCQAVKVAHASEALQRRRSDGDSRLTLGFPARRIYRPAVDGKPCLALQFRYYGRGASHARNLHPCGSVDRGRLRDALERHPGGLCLADPIPELFVRPVARGGFAGFIASSHRGRRSRSERDQRRGGHHCRRYPFLARSLHDQGERQSYYMTIGEQDHPDKHADGSADH
jgi:hypothetical protein